MPDFCLHVDQAHHFSDLIDLEKGFLIEGASGYKNLQCKQYACLPSVVASVKFI